MNRYGNFLPSTDSPRPKPGVKIGILSSSESGWIASVIGVPKLRIAETLSVSTNFLYPSLPRSAL